MNDYTLPERGKVALLTINAQRDFVASGSPLKTGGVAKAVAGMARLVKGFREASLPIVHAVRLYKADGSNVDNCRRQLVEEGLRVVMPGSMGAELLDEVTQGLGARLDADTLMAGKFQTLGPHEWVMYRPRWGAFYGTTLEQKLRELNVTSLVICGFNFAASGRATIFDAGARDFRIVVATDAVSNATDEGVEEMGRLGVYLMTVDSCLSWLSRPPTRTAAA